MTLRITGFDDPAGRAAANALASALDAAGAGSCQVRLRPADKGSSSKAMEELERELVLGSVDVLALEAGLLPHRLPIPLVGRVVLQRRDSRTACLTSTSPGTMLREIPGGGRIGALDPRHAAFLRALHPDLLPVAAGGRDPEELVASLRAGDLEALLVPAWWVGEIVPAGLGTELLNRITWVPAPGEGAVGAVFDRTSSLAEPMESLVHPPTAAEVRSELAFMESVEASGGTVVTASCLSFGPGLRLKGLLINGDGTRAVHADRTGSLEAPEPLGWAVAADVVRQSAEILA